MKIGVLTINYPRFKGDPCGSFVQELCQAYQALGHQVSVLTYYDQAFQQRTNQEWAKEGIGFIKYIWPLRWHRLGYARTLQGDVNASWVMYVQSVLLLLVGAWRLWWFVLKENPQFVHVHWLLPNGFLMSVVSRMIPCPFVITLHGSGVYMSEKNKLFRWMARQALKKALVVFSCSEDLKQRCEVVCPGIESKIHLIPNGVDISLFGKGEKQQVERLKEKWNLGQQKILLAVGRYVYKKGFEYLIEAFAALKRQGLSDWTLVLAGGGELHSLYCQIIDQEGLVLGQDIVLTGEVKHDELPDYYALASLFALPSVRDAKGNIDGLPIVLLEAMASGLPIVASHIAGVPLVCQDGQEGWLVPPGDVSALAQALQEAINHPEKCTQIGRHNAQKTKKEYSWETSAAKMIQLANMLR